VESSLDAVLIVVEPSFESVSLAERIQNLAWGTGITRVWAVLNKINSDKLAEKLNEELTKRKITVIGAIPQDEAVFTACLEGQSLVKAKDSVGSYLHKIASQLFST
jgi:CO dehydrogenase maturation factor